MVRQPDNFPQDSAWFVAGCAVLVLLNAAIYVNMIVQLVRSYL